MIREAVPAEGPTLTELAMRSKAHWGYDENFLRACRPALTIDDTVFAAGPVFVEVPDDGGDPRGFVALELDGPDGPEVTHLFVDPPYIGTGVGRRLWDRAVSAALVAGAHALVVEADPHAAPFYVRQGAQPIGYRESGVTPGRQLPLFRLLLD